MHSDFQREMYGRETIETEKGFIVFNVYEDKSAYIHQLYVKPEFRKKGSGHELEMEIVKKYKVTKLACYVDCTSDNPEQSLLAILNVGYKITNINGLNIELYKEL